jgi:tetratricopeptide (TPR) repeat protein
MTRQRMAIFAVLAITVVARAIPAAGQGVPGIIYAEQPTGIELSTYLATWPALEPEIQRLQSAQPATVMHDLARRAARPGVSDGALNLLAQLQRELGALDDAGKSIGQAIAMQPKQFLHHFQNAMIQFARLTRASGIGRWGWQRKTFDAYQRTFELNPRHVPARYYLGYSLAQTPGIAGGDKKKALRLAQEGVDLGLVEFYVVRADVHRLRDELDAAFADYDAAIDRKVFKLNSFVAAGGAALARGDMSRAKRYLEWAVFCRQDAAAPHEGLGDYYAAIKDESGARREYEIALQKEPNRESVQKKLRKSKG